MSGQIDPLLERALLERRPKRGAGMADDYAVGPGETRLIAQRFFQVHPALRADWGMTLRGEGEEPMWPDEATQQELQRLKWCAIVTEPTGHARELMHHDVLEGLHWCVHEEGAHEAWMVRDWMVTPVGERSVGDMADWVASRICQAALFGGRFPYGEADLMSVTLRAQA